MKHVKKIIYTLSILLICLFNLPSIALSQCNLSTPSNLKVVGQPCTSVTISWNAVANATGYNVEENHGYKTSVSNNQATFEYDSNLAGNTYSFKVSAYSGNGCISKNSSLLFVNLCNINESAPANNRLPDALTGNYELKFSDEFNNNKVDASKWDTRMKWGSEIIINKEQQYYVDTQSDTQVGYDPFVFDGNNLKIKADVANNNIRNKIKNQKYVSGVLASKQNFKYGYYEMRAKLPAGSGMWPAFWLYYDYNIPNDLLREIDIMEFTGGDRTAIFNNFHYEQSAGSATTHGLNHRYVKATDFTSTYHTFGVEWTKDYVKWYVDDEIVAEYSDKVSQQEMYIILNLAIAETNLGTEGDSGPVESEENEVFPAEFAIDYVRVYEKTGNQVANNSIKWVEEPTKITAGANQISVDYNINQNGLVVLQLFNSGWDLIGQEPLSVSPGSKQVTLSLTPESTPTETNYLQVKLLKPNWEDIVEMKQVEVSYNSDQPTTDEKNSIKLNGVPANITSRANQISVAYNIDQNGLLVLQLFNSGWDMIGQEPLKVSPGSRQVTISLTPDIPPTQTNYLQAKLLGSNWEDIGVEVKQVELSSNNKLSSNQNDATYGLTILPNPFVNNLMVNFSIEKSEAVSINIYSADGKQVKEIVKNKTYEAGEHNISIEEILVNSGIYFMHFNTESEQVIRKLYKN